MSSQRLDARTAARRTARAIDLIQSIGVEACRAAIDDKQMAATRAVAGRNLPTETDEIRRLLALGQHALDNLDTERVGGVDPEEVYGLESIVVTVGRPALLIRNDRFDTPPPTWANLEPYRAAIQQTCASVGRIELIGHPSLDWVGTGFVVAPGVVATNRHVVQEFARPNAAGRWITDPGVSARIDFAEEFETQAVREFPLGDVIAVHSRLDVALVEAPRDCAPVLQLDGGGVPLAGGANAYVVGYPALDSRRNDPTVMQTIFNNIYDVKRLQPGLISDWSASRAAYLHDCSTLGGNSGSCLVDLASNIVVGIHFGGRYLESNWAHSMRDLAATGYLQRLGARFR